MAGFANLTDAERERLEMLAEEASEVVKAVTKILRHGYESHNPDAPQDGSNREQLEKELVDLCTVATRMNDEGDVFFFPNGEDFNAHWKRKRRYTHHQRGMA